MVADMFTRLFPDYRRETLYRGGVALSDWAAKIAFWLYLGRYAILE